MAQFVPRRDRLALFARPVAALTITLLLGSAALAFAAPTWTDVRESVIPEAGTRYIQPDLYRTVTFDYDAVGSLLASAPAEGSARAQSQPLVIELPLPGGGSTRFAVVESPILAPELGRQFPNIRTYLGRGLDDPTATARLDHTPLGFHAVMFLQGGSVYIDPYQQKDVDHYLVYNRRDYQPTNKGDVTCEVIDEDGMAAEIHAIIQGNEAELGHGTQLRTYRTAVACTGEYAVFHGGTVPSALAAVTTSMNRVTGVYEREVSVRMTLIANNNLIIYTNGATDPYTNNNGGTMLGQNQANLDAVIGNANYDIGHVFSTGGGGVANLGVVCRTGNKARGVTGLPTPIGDGFDIDYVAHEMGHQFGGNHSFNGSSSNCAGGNRNAGTAYEPGSGSTIMAYAGICPPQDLQPHSDDYFIWINIQEIIAYTTVGSGNTCPVITATGAFVPTVNAGVGGFTIPISTPFALTGSAGTTGAPTYCWEESDLGPTGHPNVPVGNAPIFRSFDPVAIPTRTFPKLANILGNFQTIGEILPSYTRNLSFRLTVRDFQGGGVGVENASLAFFVTSNAGPFLITFPDVAGLTFPGGSQQTVIWNVANTDLAPVGCQTVNILLSTDGGLNFNTTLASGTANDGSELITLPNTATTTARIKVAAADHVFFDINNFNFTIQGTTAVDEPLAAGAPDRLTLAENRPNPFNPSTTIAFALPLSGPASLRVYDMNGRLVKTLVDAALPAGGHTAAWDGSDVGGGSAASGVYLYELRAGSERLTRRMLLLK
jgi:hypothetical protein